MTDEAKPWWAPDTTENETPPGTTRPAQQHVPSDPRTDHPGPDTDAASWFNRSARPPSAEQVPPPRSAQPARVTPPVLEVDDSSFGLAVLARSETVPVVVEFWAPWCGPSGTLGPILQQAVAQAAGEIELVRVNVDESPRSAANCKIQSIPTVVAIHHQKPVKTLNGAQATDAVRKFINSLPRVAPPNATKAERSPATPAHDGVLPNRTSAILEASQKVMVAVDSGRKRLVTACEQRAAEDQAFAERSELQDAQYSARIARIDLYAKGLSEQVETSAKKVNGGHQILWDTSQQPPTSRYPLEVDAKLSSPTSAKNLQLVGSGIDTATHALSAVSSAANRASGGWISRLLYMRGFVRDLSTAHSIAESAHARLAQLRSEAANAASVLANERGAALARNNEAVRTAARHLEQSVSSRCAKHSELLAASPVPARPGWDLAEWEAWTPPNSVGPIHLGGLSAPPDPAQQEYRNLPANVVSLTDDFRRIGGLRYTFKHNTRGSALSAGRSLIARLLASTPPGKARFTFFDPLGLGETVAPFLALADHDKTLIDGKVWSSVDDLRSRLADHMNHIEVVIQKYLRGEYESIEDYNREAGEIAEPYRFLFVFDYPSQFDEGTVHQLSRIIENGPRCGVYTVLLANTEAKAPHGTSADALPKMLNLVPNGPMSDYGPLAMTLSCDVDPIGALGTAQGQAVIDRIVDSVGRAGRGADNVTVDLRKALTIYGETIRAGVRSDLPTGLSPALLDDPSTWWMNTSEGAIAAPIGQSGARDVALLRFDSEILSGGLLLGRPGAGKSTLLHSYIGGLCALYPPSELELYLIDFKEGVEFKAYAEHGLPHARCVAVESERDFGVSVLESIVAEMKRRAELIRSTGGEQTSFARLRESLDHPLPRIVLVFDEFHVLFAEDDKLGATAADHLETIIRQGRGFGVHVVLGSQSLAGLDALGRHVLQLLPVRILLPSSESDAHLVLGESNDAWRMLNRRGEGILNAAAGASEANAPFQAAFEPEEERLTRLRLLRRKADDAGATRRPIVFEGYGASDLTEHPPADFVDAFAHVSHLTVPLRVATPMSLAGPIDVDLRREGGAHVLVVARGTHDVPLGVVLPAITSASISPAKPRIEFVDFTATDDGVEDALRPLVDAKLVTLTRRRAAQGTIGELAAEVTRRVDEDDVSAPAILLVLFGLHRARDLDPEATSDPFGPEPTDDLLSSIRQILVNGPEVGIHVLAWADSTTSLGRRLPRGLRREFGVVIAGSMNRDDSMELIDSDTAASLKSHQIAVYEDDAGKLERGRSLSIPTAEWLNAVTSHFSHTTTQK